MGRYIASVEDHLSVPATVRVTVGNERFLRLTGQPVPSPVTIRLLIDTGARRTTLIPGIVGHLRATAGTEAQVITPYGERMTDLVWVRLEFPEAGLQPVPEVLVARMPMPPGLAQFHGLLGRDLLRRLESFEYEGRRGRYTQRDTSGPFGWLRRWL
jgi:hypothetical protein